MTLTSDPTISRFQRTDTVMLWKRLHASVEATLWASRSVLDDVRSERSIEATKVMISFLKEIRDEIWDLLHGEELPSVKAQQDLLEVWAFELNYVSQREEFDKVDDETDTLVRLIAEACLWLSALLPHDGGMCEPTWRYFQLVDAISSEALDVITSQSLAFDSAAA